MFLRLILASILIAPAMAEAATPPAHAQETFPTFGVSVMPPAGWVRSPDLPSVIAQWDKLSPTPDPDGHTSATDEIVVDFRPGGGKTLRELAATRAQQIGGSVQQLPTTLGGSAAMRIISPSTAQSPQYAEVILTAHEGYCFGLGIASARSGTASRDFEAARASWKWVPTEPPVRHLEPGAPQEVLGGVIKLTCPAGMRPVPVQDPAHEINLAAHNMARNDMDFSADVQWLKTSPGLKLSALQERFSASLQKRTKLDAPLAWTADPKLPGRTHTQFALMTVPGDDGKSTTSYAQWALVDLGLDRVALVNFVIPSEVKEADRKAFAAAAAAIFASIQPGAAPPTQP